jgi:multidrug resistance efflux pump
MASRTSIRVVALGLIVVAAGAAGYRLSRPESTPPIVGVVRTTEVRIAPEVGGQLTAIKVQKGDRVQAGDVVAELSAIELTASVGQARAALAAATADRNNVYAGVRAEQVASLKAEIAKAKSRLEYAEQQLSRTDTLARSDNASQQALDQSHNDAASARTDVAEAKANYDAAVAGPTKEERAIADAQVKAAAYRASLGSHAHDRGVDLFVPIPALHAPVRVNNLGKQFVHPMSPSTRLRALLTQNEARSSKTLIPRPAAGRARARRPVRGQPQ